jgi:hypothetical protein
MSKSLIFLATLFLFLASCTKNNQVEVSYETTGAISEYNLYYLDNGTMQQTVVRPESAQDKWNFRYVGEEGDIVYVSGKYSDPNSSLKIMIKVNGKVYKQASNQGDTLRYLTVSGVVPIN